MNRYNFINGPMPKKEYCCHLNMKPTDRFCLDCGKLVTSFAPHAALDRLVEGYHQCAYGSFTFGRPEIDNVRGHERCQTMLSEGSPPMCPEHEPERRRQMFIAEDLAYRARHPPINPTGATTEQINEAMREIAESTNELPHT